jgi:hypothetical protein
VTDVYTMKHCRKCSDFRGMHVKTVHGVTEEGWTCLSCKNFVRRNRWLTKKILEI